MGRTASAAQSGRECWRRCRARSKSSRELDARRWTLDAGKQTLGARLRLWSTLLGSALCLYRRRMQAGRTPGLAMRTGIVMLTAWGLLMIVPDLSRVVRPLASAGFAADNDGHIYDVRGPFRREQDSPAWKAGLRVGDQIDFAAMECGPPRPRGCTALLSVLGGMGGAQLVRRGKVLTLTVLPVSGGPARVVHVAAQPNPTTWVSRLLLLLNELAGIAVVVAAAWLLWTQPSAMTLGFWLYAVWFNPGQDFVYFLVLQERPLLAMAQETLASLAHGAACAGLLLFALRVPNDRSEPQWWFVMAILP